MYYNSSLTITSYTQLENDNQLTLTMYNEIIAPAMISLNYLTVQLSFGWNTLQSINFLINQLHANLRLEQRWQVSMDMFAQCLSSKEMLCQ